MSILFPLLLFAVEDYSRLLDFNYLPETGTIISKTRLNTFFNSSAEDKYSLQTANEELLFSLSPELQLGLDFKYIFLEDSAIFRENVKEVAVKLNLALIKSEHFGLILGGFYGLSSDFYSSNSSISLDKKEIGADLKLAGKRHALGSTIVRAGSNDNLNMSLYFYYQAVKQSLLNVTVGIYANTDKIKGVDTYQNTTISPYGSIALILLPNLFLEVEARPVVWEIIEVNNSHEISDTFDKAKIPLSAQLTFAF